MRPANLLRLQAGVLCTPSTPTPVRQRRRPNQDLRQRLARCEELLLQHAGAAQVPAPRPPEREDLLMSGPTGNEFPQPPRPACLVVQDEGSTRLVDNYVWASLYQEVSVCALCLVTLGSCP
jgi:hypothetical protein